MKKLIARYWGIALVLAILVGLLVPAMPVSAGDTAWSTVSTPPSVGAKITGNTNISFLQMAADGKTMFTYDNNNMVLRKSTDSGMTWSGTGYGVGLNTKTLTAFAISSAFATDNTLIAADFAASVAVVYMSTDGGKNWFSPIVLPSTAAPVVTLAVGADYQGGTRALIGTSTGAAGGALYSWISRTFTITTESIANSGSGSGATATAAMGVAVLAAAPVAAGTGYTVGDVLTLTGGSATATVATITGGGATGPVGTVTLTTAGTGYTVSGTVATTGGTGTGATVSITSLKVISITVTAGGTLYTAATLAIAAPPVGGTQATATVGVTGGAVVNPVTVTAQGAGYVVVPAVTVTGIGTGGDVLAAAMSPNFAADGEVLAVVANTVSTQLHAKLAANAWDASTGRVTFTGITAAVGAMAVMNFGADYDFSSNAYVLVGFSGTAVDDLWRGKVGTSPATAADLFINGAATTTAVNSVAVKGNLADGTVYVGYAASAGVASATGVTGTAVWTTTNAKAPSGTTKTIVKVAANGIVAGTSGLGSAISLSTDNNVTYNMASMISFSSTAGVNFVDMKVVDSNTMFLLAQDAVGTYGVVFKTTDAGATWWGVYNNTTVSIFGVFPSPAYATDSTVYVPLNNLSVRKSVNGGTSYSTAIVGGTAPISSFVAVDGTNFFVGSAGGLIYKSGRFVSFATLPAAELATGLAVGGGNVVAAGNAGNVYISTDDGVTFTLLGAAGLGVGTLNVMLDPAYATNKVIYVGVTGVAGLARYTTAFTTIDTGALGSAMTLSNDGNLYYGGTVVRRALNPATPVQGWDSMPVTAASGWLAGGNIVKMGIVNTLLSGTAYVHDVYALVNGITDAVYPYAGRIIVFSDKLTNPLTLTAPAANAVVSTTQKIVWGAYPGLPASTVVMYDVQVAQDAAFTLGLQTPASMLGTQWAGAALTPGETYFVRVRVSAASPLLSNWSPTVTFSVKLTQAGNDITGGFTAVSPGPGATNVAVKPAFSWAAVNNAVSYNLQVSDNPVFVNPLDNQTGLNTNVWLETKTLDPGKTYYWRIQAVTASGVTSDWFSFTFTTAAPAAPATTPTVSVTVTAPAQPAITLPAVTVTQTPAPLPKFFDPISGQYFNTQADLQAFQSQHPSATPATPAYIWVIIVIGAVLVIAVIVLIARTRRV